MMKILKLTTVVTIVMVLSSLVSCKKGFLDQVPDDRITIDDVFKKRSTTEQYLANVYLYIRSDVDWNTGSPWEGLSDEADVTYSQYATYPMNLGNWDRNRGDYNYWDNYYKGIRSASYFIQRVGENPELSPDLIAQYRAEARALRAMFYYFIMRQYGPAVILPETPLPPDASLDDMQLSRSSFDECAAYVSSEIDKALPDLKQIPAGTGDALNWGRINKGMALAIKSRLWLLSASPLFNGNADYNNFKNPDGKQLVSQTNDLSKWQKAADAAKALIEPERLFSVQGTGWQW